MSPPPLKNLSDKNVGKFCNVSVKMHKLEGIKSKINNKSDLTKKNHKISDCGFCRLGLVLIHITILSINSM